jgi:hypothetical protein
MPVPRDRKEDRLLESSASLDIEEKAAARELSHPSHSMLYPEYKQRAEALKDIRIKCAEKRRAVRADRNMA